MSLLKVNNDNGNLKKSNTTKEQMKNIEEYLKNSYENSYEISDKFEVNETNIETKTKKKETIWYLNE